MIIHGSHKCIRITQQITTELITVFLNTSQEPGNRLHKCIIVHNGIPLIALQPFLWISIMLCQYNCIWICLFDCVTEHSPELVIIFLRMSEICCYIQSPTIHIIWRGHPFLCYIQNIFHQFWGIFIVQLWKCIMPPPTIVGGIVRPYLFVIKLKERLIRTAPGYKCSLLVAFLILIDTLTIHPFVEGTAMVKYTI